MKRVRSLRGEATTEDYYCTPPFAVEALLPLLPPEICAWEPTFGAGAITNVLEAAGHTTIKSDFFPKDTFPCQKLDFLHEVPEKRYDWIVFNPPFSQLADFLRRACELDKPFAMLCPIYTFETPARQQLIKEFRLSVLMLKRRCNFRKANGHEKKGTPFLSVWILKHPDYDSKILFQESL